MSSSHDPDREDSTLYKVVVNHEEQYSIWPEYKANPLGWHGVGKTGPKAECLAYIKDVWNDMRPLSLRKKMEEMAENPPPPLASASVQEESLVDRLCKGDHKIEVVLRPEPTPKQFQEAIERHYVQLKFSQTRGGTELGVRLDREASDFDSASFENRTGGVHLEGMLTLDYVKVRCIADIDLQTLAGRGYLVKVEAQAQS